MGIPKGACGRRYGQAHCKTKLIFWLAKRTILFFREAAGLDAVYWSGKTPWACFKGDSRLFFSVEFANVGGWLTHGVGNGYGDGHPIEILSNYITQMRGSDRRFGEQVQPKGKPRLKM